MAGVGWQRGGVGRAAASISLRRAPPPLTHFLAPPAWVGAVCAAGKGRGFDLATADGPYSLPTPPPPAPAAGDPSHWHTHTLASPSSWAHFTPPFPPKLVQMLGGVSTALLAAEPWVTCGFHACDQGSKCRHASQPDRPERCLKEKKLPQFHNLRNHKVLYVTVSCAVSMYAMLAANGHQPVRYFDLLVSKKPDRRPQGDEETDPVPDPDYNETLTETPTGALRARSVVVVDSQSIIIVFYHTPCCLFCLT